MDIKKPRVGAQHNRLVKIVKVKKDKVQVVEIDGERYAVTKIKPKNEGMS